MQIFYFLFDYVIFLFFFQLLGWLWLGLWLWLWLFALARVVLNQFNDDVVWTESPPIRLFSTFLP